MQTASLIMTASYLPKTIVTNNFFEEPESELKANPFFKGVKERRHVDASETPEYMMLAAINELINNLNLNPQSDIDMILTNVSVPSEIFMGSGAIIAKRLGAKPKYVFDFHHSGCISFVTMLDLAKNYIEVKRARHALICNVQNSGGSIFNQPNIRKKPHACIPGDGCGVAYIAATEDNPILSVTQACHTENAEGMYGASEDGRKHWQPGSGELYLDFDEAKIAKTMAAGNKIVPAAIYAACKDAGINYQDIDLLITNQPSRLFLRNWREAVQLPKEKHLHTFAELGNLFGAAIPINLTQAIEQKLLKSNDNLVLAGFSHAGDFSAAAVIKWQSPL